MHNTVDERMVQMIAGFAMEDDECTIEDVARELGFEVRSVLETAHGTIYEIWHPIFDETLPLLGEPKG